MKICSYCGRENEDFAPSCQGCGTSDFKSSVMERLAETQQRPHATKLLWTCIMLLFAWLAIVHRTNLPAHIRFWTGILLLAALLVVVWKTYGKRGLGDAIFLGLTLALADGTLPVFGKTGQWVFTIIFVLVCICVYCRRVYLRRQPKAQSNHKAA